MRTTDHQLPGAIGAHLLLLLAATGDRVRDELDEALRPLGLRSRHLGPMLIAFEEAPIAQNRLAERAGLDKSAMVRLIDDLHALGLVRREPVPHDRRSYWIAVTRAGQRTLRMAQQAMATLEETLFADLQPDERDLVRDALMRVASRIASDAHEGNGER